MRRILGGRDVKSYRDQVNSAKKRRMEEVDQPTPHGEFRKMLRVGRREWKVPASTR